MKNQNTTPEPTAPEKPDAYSRSHPSTGSPLAWSSEIVSAIMFCDTAWAQQWGNGPEWPIDHIETEAGFVMCDINGPFQSFHMSDIARIRIVRGPKDGEVFENEEFYPENVEGMRGE